MKRRTFVHAAMLAPLAAYANAAEHMGQRAGDLAASLRPTVWPEERDELREYDHTRPDVVVWKSYEVPQSYPPDVLLKPVFGFIEAQASEQFIPMFRGLQVRHDIPQSDEGGFYFYFGMTIGRLMLPRRVRGKAAEDRYANPYWERSERGEAYPAGWVRFDHRQIRLVESGGRVSMPTGELWHGGGNRITGPAPLLSMDAATAYPRKSSTYPTLDINGIVRFDIAHKPVRFKLELPPLAFGEVEMPLPVCHFEPYDVLSKRWV